jgi:hypothetical protein
MDGLRTAFWRCLHTPGHDTALLARALSGRHLTGTAVYRGEEGPVCVNYMVDIDDEWRATRGSIRGIAGGRRFFHSIERKPDGWTLDGRPNGMAELVDLDFGFTPATNIQQLSRLRLSVGERAAFSVVWFDIGRGSLMELPQIYERKDESHYQYHSPTNDYRAMLELHDNGFVRNYPDLWVMEPDAHAGDSASASGRSARRSSVSA